MKMVSLIQELSLIWYYSNNLNHNDSNVLVIRAI